MSINFIRESFPGEKAEVQESLSAIYRMILNNTHYMVITPDEDSLGFQLKTEGERWTHWAVYRVTSGLFSVYESVPDIMRGIDAADEKPILESVSMNQAVNTIRYYQERCDPHLYSQQIETSEGVQRRVGGTVDKCTPSLEDIVVDALNSSYHEIGRHYGDNICFAEEIGQYAQAWAQCCIDAANDEARGPI